MKGILQVMAMRNPLSKYSSHALCRRWCRSCKRIDKELSAGVGDYALRSTYQQIESKSKHLFDFFWSHAGLRFWLWRETWRWFIGPVYIYYGNAEFSGNDADWMDDDFQ